MMWLAAVGAIAGLMLAAAPAMADGHRDWDDDLSVRLVGDDFCDFFGFFGCINHDDDEDDFCDFVDCRDDDDFDRFDFNDGFGDFEQDAESGDIDQSFDVSGTGDNSNQTVGIQGVANTGNAQNQIGVIDAGDFADFDNNNDDFCDDFDCDEDDFCDDFRGDDFCEDLEDFCDDFDGNGICDFFDDDDDF